MSAADHQPSLPPPGARRPDPAIGYGLRVGTPGTLSPPRAHTHTHSHGLINTARTARPPSQPPLSVGARKAALPFLAKGHGGPYWSRRVRSSRAQAQSGDPARRRERLRSGRTGRDEGVWARVASAQHAAFAPAQLPAQLAAPLLQAALQALILLQGAGRERVPVSPSGVRAHMLAAARGPDRAVLLDLPHSASPAPGASRPHSRPLLLVQVPDQLVSLVHQRHQLLQQELLSALLRSRFQPVCEQRRLRVRRRLPMSRPGPRSYGPISHLQWPASPVAPGSAAQISAPSPALRCWGVGCQVRERGMAGSVQGSDHSLAPTPPHHQFPQSHRQAELYPSPHLELSPSFLFFFKRHIGS